MAAKQHGVVTTAQLAACGLSRHAIDTRVRRGQLHRLHRGVYAVGHLALPPFGRESAALLACGPGAVLSHLSAAAVWGFADPRPTVDVAVTRARRPRARGVRVHRPASLDEGDVRMRDGMRVTSPARTVVDLARILSLAALERLLSDAHAAKVLRPGELERRHPLPPRLRALLHDGPGLTKSEAERELLRLLERAGLPRPEANVLVAGCQVDALWREHGVAVEVDSWTFHGHRAAFERDRRRDVRLRAAGVLPIRLTARQIGEEPEAVVAHLAQVLATRGSRTALPG